MYYNCFEDYRYLNDFPTRRTSDLDRADGRRAGPLAGSVPRRGDRPGRGRPARGEGEGDRDRPRSEEHTSELQSHVNLVCRLLLEKKIGRKKPSRTFKRFTYE